MAAAILTVLASFVVAGTIWLTLGARLALSDDEAQNGVRNLAAYFLAVLPFVFALVFFLVERL